MIFALLVACTGPKVVEDTSDPPDINQDDTAVECNAAAPVITEATVTNGGIVTYDNGDWPTVAIEMDVSDSDGDLDILGMYIWFDDTVDGTVDRSGDAAFEAPAYLFEDAVECQKFTAGLNMKPAITGQNLAYSTRYEFAIEAEDRHAVRSLPYITDGVTPNSDGSDGSAP